MAVNGEDSREEDMPEQADRRIPFWGRIPEIWLIAGALWTALFLPVYGLLFEEHSYSTEMLFAGGVAALVLAALGWVHGGLFLVGALLVGLANAIYAHVAHFWRIGNLLIRIQTALDSSPGEAKEFFETFVFRSKFAWFLFAYVFLGLVLGGIYIYWRRRRPLRWSWVWRLLVLLGVLGGAWKAQTWMTAYPTVVLATTTYKAYQELKPLLERKENWDLIQSKVPDITCRTDYEKILFILGESANRDFMSVYGYDLETTPFLDRLEPKVVLRAISPVNQTMTSVPMLFTEATVENYDAFYTSPSIITYLKKCGYQTFWISNQLRYSPYTSSVSSIASEADVVRFVLEELRPKTTPYDEVLLELLRPDDLVPGRKQAFFFHLLGSHFNWEDRYPPDRALIPQPENLLETYVNTIYYSDYVVSQIFEAVRASTDSMLFVYVSDHGEYVTEDEAGHAFATAFQEEYRSPLVYWSTSPERLLSLAEAADDRLVNLETLDLQILYLVGVREDPGLSFSTQVFSLGPPRVRDYTELLYLEYLETP